MYIYIILVVSRTTKIAYLALNGKSWNWVTKVFKAQLGEDANKELFVTLDKKTDIHVDQYFSYFHEVTVKLPLRSGAGPSEMSKHKVLLMCWSAHLYHRTGFMVEWHF